ncbi:MAG TPA: TonB family protein [Verrucomicrobiae bacterium]|nr:TonB family protein [Verrucomicrobiae bacterium]
MILTPMAVVTDSPAATRTPMCANPNQEATVTNAVYIVAPNWLQRPTTVLVEVTIGPAGNLIEARVTRSHSSGNAVLDEAALRAARASQYAPKLVNCMPTTGATLFRAVFIQSSPTPTAPP